MSAPPDVPPGLHSAPPAYQPQASQMSQGNSSEKPPENYAHDQQPHRSQYGQQQSPPHNTQQPQGMPPLPPGWVAQWSQEHNTWFYVDTATGTTQWQLPTSNTPPSQSPPPNQPGFAAPTAPAPNDQQHYTYGQDPQHPMHNQDQQQSTYNQGGAPQYGAPQYGAPQYGAQQEGMPGPDGDRGLGKVLMVGGAGLLAAASFGPLKHKFGKMFGNKPADQQGYYQQPQQQYNYGAPPQGAPYGGGSGGYGQPTYAGMPPPPHGGAPPPLSGYVNPAGGAPRGVAPLYIHAATYADKDVTPVVRSMIGHEQKIELKGSILSKHFGDPWPAVERKALIIIYQYGDRPWELLAMDTESSVTEIAPGPISKKRMDYCQPSSSRILCVLWGTANATPAAVAQELDRTGEMEATHEGLGDGGFYSWEQRTLVCFYRNDNGSISIATCREGTTLRMPWNELAKWS